MSADELAAIALRLDRGPTTKGVTLSPWAKQMQRDAFALLKEVRKLRSARRVTRS